MIVSEVSKLALIPTMTSSILEILNSWLFTIKIPVSKRIIFLSALIELDENDSVEGRSRVRY
jgi:hypothetical protein